MENLTGATKDLFDDMIPSFECKNQLKIDEVLDNINERLLKLEEVVTTNIQSRPPSKTRTRSPRKGGTLADVDVKLNTILDILTKLVVPAGTNCYC